MNREKFHQQLSDPAILDGASLPELETLTREFPWFQGGRMLYLKALHNTENLLYPGALKTTAVYASDRKVLYALVHSVKKKQAKETVIPELITPVIEPPKKVSEFIQEKKKELESKTLAEESISGTGKKTAADLLTGNLTDEQKKRAEEKILEATRSADLAKKQFTEFDEIKKAEKDLAEIAENITVDAIHAGYESQSIEIKDREDEEEIPAEQLEDIRKKIGLPKKLGFSSWLKAIDEGAEMAEEVSEKELPKPSVEAIIDKFISEEPRISKPKKEFYSPVNMAKQSVLDDENIVTETLARIYVKQEKYQKAIRAYEVLSLKFPDKKRYFAALIEEIKNKESK